MIEQIGSVLTLGRTALDGPGPMGVGMVDGGKFLVAQIADDDELLFDVTPVTIRNYQLEEGTLKQVPIRESLAGLTFTYKTGTIPWIIHMQAGVNVVVLRRTEDNRKINLEQQQKVIEEIFLVDDDGNALTGPEEALEVGLSEGRWFFFRFSDTVLGQIGADGERLRLEWFDIAGTTVTSRYVYIDLLTVPGGDLEIVNFADLGSGRCFIVVNDPVSSVHYLVSTDEYGSSFAVEGPGQLRNPGHLAVVSAGAAPRVLGWFTYGGFNDFAILDIVADLGSFSGTVSASPLSIPRYDLSETTWQSVDLRSQGGLSSGTLLYWTYDYSPNRTIYLTEIKSGPIVANELSWNWANAGYTFNDLNEYRQIRPGLGLLAGNAMDGSFNLFTWLQLVGDVVSPPLRMTQRDDGLSLPSGQAPRIKRIGNQPSSAQTTESPRMQAGGQRYL